MTFYSKKLQMKTFIPELCVGNFYFTFDAHCCATNNHISLLAHNSD